MYVSGFLFPAANREVSRVNLESVNPLAKTLTIMSRLALSARAPADPMERFQQLGSLFSFWAWRLRRARLASSTSGGVDEMGKLLKAHEGTWQA